MSLRVVQTPESLADIASAKESVDAVNATVRLLATHPWIGKDTDYTHPRLAGIRLFLVQKPFNKHLIFYRVCGATLDIVRVVHGLRDLPTRLLNPPEVG